MLVSWVLKIVYTQFHLDKVIFSLSSEILFHVIKKFYVTVIYSLTTLGIICLFR
jgi:hypothetical protein